MDAFMMETHVTQELRSPGTTMSPGKSLHLDLTLEMKTPNRHSNNIVRIRTKVLNFPVMSGTFLKVQRAPDLGQFLWGPPGKGKKWGLQLYHCGFAKDFDPGGSLMSPGIFRCFPWLTSLPWKQNLPVSWKAAQGWLSQDSWSWVSQLWSTMACLCNL